MFRRRYSLLLLLLVVVLVVVSQGSVLANGQPDGDDRPVTVMTRNLYLGADLGPIYAAIGSGDPQQIGQAVIGVYQGALASNFFARANVIAQEIAATQPALIGLQEVVSWSGPFGGVEFLPVLQGALATQGLSYEVILGAPGFAYDFPLGTLGTVSLSDRDVILVRTDLMVSRLKLSNVQTGQYQAKVIFPLPGGSLVTVPRTWISVDVKIRGRSFRFISTHLESIGPPFYPYFIRPIQAAELLAGPAATDLPVVIVGDINSEPGTVGDAAYILIAGGFADSWAAAYPGQAGYTCCHPADLSQGLPFTKQIDLILFRGDFRATAAEVTGDSQAEFDLIGQWASDHGGVAATLLIPSDPD